MSNEEIEQLVIRAQQNDEEAFEHLYQSFYKKVYVAAYKLCRNDADAKDATQMAFIQMQQSIHTLKQPAYFPFWINQVVLNKCKNMFRKRNDILFNDEYYDISNQIVEQRKEANAEKNVRFQTDKEVLLQMIRQLSKEQQEVLELTYFKQMNNDEVAKVLNIPVGTIKSRLSSARNNLRNKVSQYEKKENISLDFKENTIFSAFVYLALTKQKSIPVSIPPCGKIKNLISQASSSSVIAKTSVSLLCGAVGIGGSVFVMDQSKNYNAQENISEEAQKNATFPKIKVMDYTIDNSQDAYYVLRGWSFDNLAMQKKDPIQIEQVIPLYQALKEKDDIFFELLKSSGWSSSFEKLANL